MALTKREIATDDPPTHLTPIFLADDFSGIGVHVFDLLGWEEKAMTDCIHNDKRTCLHERMELVAEIEKLKTEKNTLQHHITILRWEIETLKNPDAVNRYARPAQL